MCYSYISEFDTISHTVVCIAELCGVLTVECVMCVGCVCSCTSLRRLAEDICDEAMLVIPHVYECSAAWYLQP